ncbi:MAG: permease [Solirubrobacteraceae bacterium]
MVVLEVIWHGIRDSLLMAWQVWWALVLGFLISAIVQAWVPRQRIEALMSGSGVRPVAWATGLGAGSSSCSYAAIAIGKSLFQKGASATSALAFQFASTNLVWELGLVLWVLIGWQFTLAEYVGGIVMILLMSVLLRVFVGRGVEQHAREHAAAADTGHQHHMAGEQLPWRQRLTSASAWSDVAHNFRGDLQMLYREIGIGFLLAGFIAQLGNGFFEHVFIRNAPAPLPTLENVVVGPVIAVLSFVCSVGNVPLAAVLWSGGISFGGVLAFLFADLIVLPIIAIYRKYYGTAYTLRIVALMFVTMALAALAVDGAFSALGLVPNGPRPTRADVFSDVKVNYKLALNVVGLAIFGALFALTVRRGATDPVCGMSVDRSKAHVKQLAGHTYHFCSEHCANAFEAEPGRYVQDGAAAAPAGDGDRMNRH